MNLSSRRLFLKTSFVSGVLGFLGTKLFASNITPSDSQGPFYPVTPQKDKDFDLTRIEGHSGEAKGQIIYIRGKVLDENLKPIENATVDIWQANAAGRYRHPHDTRSAALDENFQGWAIVQSGAEGSFNFKSIMPGSYKVNNTWARPPHIHFKVSKAGYHELVTQMYFPKNKLNEKDLLLQSKTANEQKLMIAKKVEKSTNTFEYTIVLRSI